MKRLLLAAIAAATLAGSAIAADLKVPPYNKTPALTPVTVSWQGLYLDGYFQYGANITKTPIYDGGSGAFIADLSTTPHGPGIGGALGYLFDTGTFVFGPRVDISYLNTSGSGQVGNVLSVSNATNYLGNVDLILGLPITADRRLLAYLDGGFAFGGAKPNLNFGTISAAANDTSTGWNIGGGLRYQLPKSAFPLPSGVFIEGNYYQLGDKQLTGTDPLTGAAIITSSNHYHFLTQKFGLTWNF